MSIDCFNATNSNSTDVVCSEVQEIPCRLSTTSLEVFDIETSGNNGVLDLNDTKSRVSLTKISLSDKQKPESKHEILKRYQSIHLKPEETSFEGAHSSGIRNDSKLESEDAASPFSATGTQRVRQNDSQAKCRFYQRNNFCKFGQSCRFLHEGGQLAPSENYLVPSAFDEDTHTFDKRRRFRNFEENEYFFGHRRSYNARPVCQYYQYYGYCDYGDHCKYEHSFMPQTDRSKKQKETPVKNSKKNFKEKENRDTYSVNTVAAASNHPTVLESHVSDGDIDSPSPLGDIKSKTDKPNEKRNVCRFFKQYGSCKYEDRCTFLHVPHTNTVNSDVQKTPKFDGTGAIDLLAPPSLDDTKSEIENLQPKKTKRPRKKADCRFFKQYGNCKYGDLCRYSHEISTSISMKIDDEEIEIIPCSGGDIDDQSSANLSEDKSDVQSRACKQSPKSDAEIFELPSKPSLPKPLALDATKSEAENLQPKKIKRPRKKADCRFFKQYGNCKYEDRCRYSHEISTSNSTKVDYEEKPEEIEIESIPYSGGAVSSDDQSSENVREDKNDVQSGACNQSPKMAAEILPSKPSLPKHLAAIQIHLLDQLSGEDLKVLRQTEITQLNKRFPKCEVLQEDNSGSEYVVEFYSSDPDWPFEVKLLHLKVLFPAEYPLKPCFVEVVDVEDHFPETLVRYLDRSIDTWIKKRHDETSAANKVEIVFKPFLRWLDRNLEDLFINGLRMVKKERDAEAAGIEFIPYEKLQLAANQDFSDTVQVPETEMLDNQVNVAKDSAPLNGTTPLTETRVTSDGVMSTSLKRGTEVVLRNLALGENAATLVCRRIALTLQCGRCKTRNEIESPANRANRIFCTKCHHVQTLTYRPQLLHQFGCVLGYLDLAGCQVVDMPVTNCSFEICCLQCSTNMPLNGLHYGQRNDNWCHNCNSKMTIFVESVKFHQLQPSTNQVGKGHLIKLEPKEKRVKDPAIQEGKPLPSDGTCKHFKKSYRWLRFPCCGKAYPCDVCHNEKEPDHDMKFATRMICGFCAKEQPYSSEKPCVLCKSNMTKKASTHWEGGKGCRDKTKMSRDDQHKYAGTSKTVSRKTQEKAKPVAKK